MAQIRTERGTTGRPPLDRHVENYWFDTDGTTAPSVFSGNIASVARLTDNTSTNAFYRITLHEEVYRSPTNGRSIYKESASITNAHDTQYTAHISDRSGSPSGGSTPTALQIDVIVLDHEQTTIAPTWVNNVPAGHRVFVEVVMDMAESA